MLLILQVAQGYNYQNLENLKGIFQFLHQERVKKATTCTFQYKMQAYVVPRFFIIGMPFLRHAIIWIALWRWTNANRDDRSAESEVV